jgi:hypothetical protein
MKCFVMSILNKNKEVVFAFSESKSQCFNGIAREMFVLNHIIMQIVS